MDSLFLDQLDPNEVPPRPPQKGAKIFYDSTGVLKVRKFASIEPIYGTIDSSDISDASDAGKALLTAESNAYQANLLPRNGYYVMSYFKPGDESIFVATSPDGINWTEIATNSTLTGVRDPSIVFWQGWWYCSSTLNGFNPPESRFTLSRSSDGINWEFYRYVDLAGVAPNAQDTWAPALQIIDNKIIALVSVREDVNFNVYLIQDWNDDLSTNGVPTIIDGLSTTSIDAEVVSFNGTYYMFYKDQSEATPTINVATSSTIEGPYTIVKSGDWAGWGQPKEAPNLIRLKDGNWRIYMDNYTQVFYSDSTTSDLLGTWSSPQLIAGVTARHPTVQNVPFGASNIVPPSLPEETRAIFIERDINSTTSSIVTATAGSRFAAGNSNAEYGVALQLYAPTTTVGYSSARNLVPLAQIFNGRSDNGDNKFIWASQIKMYVDFIISFPYSSGSKIRFYLGAPQAYTNGTINKKAVGFELINNLVYGVRHDGTILESTDGVQPFNRAWNRIFLLSNGGTVSYYLNYKKIGELTSPTGITGWPDMAFVVSNENDGTAQQQNIIIPRVGYGFDLTPNTA